VGESAYVPHPGCTTSDKCWLYVNTKGVGYYCNKCGGRDFSFHGVMSMSERRELQRMDDEVTQSTQVVLPNDYSLTIPDEGLVWLLKAGINSNLAASHCIGWSESLRRVILPVYSGRTLMYYQARSIDGRAPKYINPRVSKERVLFGFEYFNPDIPVCITEDILSAVRVSEFMPTVSALGTKLSRWAVYTLGQAPKVYIWLDPDKAGRKGRIKMRQQLQWTTKPILITTDRDPKYYTGTEIKEILHV